MAHDLLRWRVGHGPFGPSFPRRFGVKIRRYFRLTKGPMKTHDRRALEDNGVADQPGRVDQRGQNACDASIQRPLPWSTLPQPIRYQKLMFDENRLGDEGARPARA